MKSLFLHWLILILFVVGLYIPFVLIQNYKNSGYYDVYFQARHDYNRELNYSEIMRFAGRLDAQVDLIESQLPNWYPIASDVTAYMLVAEMAAQFQYEGASKNTNYPTIYFEAANMGGRHNHIAGYSNCEEYFVLNLRFANPVSTWNSNPEWIATLAHELAHNHQRGSICQNSPIELIETTAQLMSWEVLAGLANQGNEIALFTLVYNLKGDALSTALGMALQNDGDALIQFENELQRLNNYNSLKFSRYQKSMRYWANDMERLEWILVNYSAQPLNFLAEHRFGGTIPHLAINNDTKDLEIDDLLYVLENLEVLVEQALKNGENEKNHLEN